MANIKFSAFTTETDDTQIDFLAGYQGTTMKKIAPANLSGSYPFLISSTSLYSGSLAPSLVGTPASNTTLSQQNFAITTGAKNTFMGATCGINTTVGDSNVAIGHNAMRLSVEATKNIAIGSGALQNLNPPATGAANDTFNIAIGFNAGNDITEGISNVIVGGNAGNVLTTGTRNTAIGHNALNSEITGSYNTAIGLNALQDLVAGTNAYNTAVGSQSLKDCTTGEKNTAIGAQIADTLLTGSNNSLLGYNAEPSSSSVDNEITLGNTNVNSLRIPGLQSGASDGDVLTFSSGTGNITLQAGGGGGGATSLNGLSDVLIDGTSAYFINIPAGLSGNPVDNLVIGDTAGDALTTGFSNVLLGHDAGLALTTGDYNINIGTEAGKTNTTTDGQINIGFEAGSLSTNGYHVHIGYNAAKNGDPLSTTSNVAIGKNAMLGVAATTNTYASVAIGEDALKDITTGDRLMGIGARAGQGHTSNGDAIYIGYNAGGQLNASNTVIIGNGAVDSLVGSWNQHTVVGKDACAATSSGSGQVAFGYQALISQTSGNKNSAFGYECLESLTTGGDNVAFGYEAGDKVTGTQNTLFGSQAGSSGTNDLTSGDANILIGYNSAVSAATVSNEVNLYNGSVTARFQGAAAAWSFVSDARDKKDIEDLELGLDFVNKLKPRKFKWDLRDSDVDKDKESSGFIAQEVKEVLDEMENDYTEIVDTNNPDQYTVSQANIIPMLVKAIQELKAEIELLKSKQ